MLFCGRGKEEAKKQQVGQDRKRRRKKAQGLSQRLGRELQDKEESNSQALGFETASQINA